MWWSLHTVWLVLTLKQLREIAKERIKDADALFLAERY